MLSTGQYQVVDEFVITPSDTKTIKQDAGNTRGYNACGLYVDADDTFKVQYASGTIVSKLFKAGYHPLLVVQVFATPTPTANIYGTITGGV